MKRAPIVLTGTAAGLVAVIGYHAASPQAALTGPSSSGTSASTLSLGGSGSAAAKSSSTASSSGGASATTASNAAASSPRSAVGGDVQYGYGDIEVKVTMSGSRITEVSLVKHDANDPRSQMIDQVALPELPSQALSAQSANIQGVSGASYTSAAYEQSLQSAIDKLKA